MSVKSWVHGMGRLGLKFKEPGVGGGDREREGPRHPRERSVPLEALPVSGWAVSLTL